MGSLMRLLMAWYLLNASVKCVEMIDWLIDRLTDIVSAG